MNMDSLPEEVDFVFFVEALPEDGLHRVAIAVEGMDAPIPTMMIAVDIDSALRVADRLASTRTPAVPSASMIARASARSSPGAS